MENPARVQELRDLIAQAPEFIAPGTAQIIPAADFAAEDEPGANPLLGQPGNIVIPENGDVMWYGDGGAGKTTLTIDEVMHLACGLDWLGVLEIPKPVRVLILENEGPRPLYRMKLR